MYVEIWVLFCFVGTTSKALSEFAKVIGLLIEKKSRQQSSLATLFVRRDTFAAGNVGMEKRMKNEDILKPICEDNRLARTSSTIMITPTLRRLEG
jgi:hypothetical protein